MLKQTFLSEMKYRNFIDLANGWALFRKKWVLRNFDTDERIVCKTPEKAFACDIGGLTVGDFVERANIDIFTLRFDGGRGSGSGKRKKPGAGGNLPPPDGWSDLPARMNVQLRANARNVDDMLDVFRKNHVLDKKESLILVDEDGFVMQYRHGNESSVSFSERQISGSYVAIHNHPSNSGLSSTDLKNFAASKKQVAVVASGRTQDYIIRKTNGFKSEQFTSQMLKTYNSGLSKVKTLKEHDQLMDEWLLANQRKYKYKYEIRSRKQ